MKCGQYTRLKTASCLIPRMKETKKMRIMKEQAATGECPGGNARRR